MIRAKASTIITVAVIAIAVVCVAGLVVNQRLEIVSGDTRYNALLDQYIKSVKDCADANDCTSTVPAPSTIVEQGTPGQNGLNGQNATDNQVERAVEIYCDLRLDCQGPMGLDGLNGTNGTNGVDGTNGADGSPGPQGPQGDTGPTGAAGADGQPPFSWTYTDALGMQHTCTRDDPFDAAAPTYTCN
jgi:hypothetical protein